MSRSTLRLWLPVVVWTAVILAASGTPLSSAHTGSALEKLIHAVLGDWINPTAVVVANFMIRKLGHVTVYGILSALVYRAVRADRPGRNIRWTLVAIAFAAVIGSIDEFHQAFVPGRTGTPWDTVVDTLGAALTQVLFFR